MRRRSRYSAAGIRRNSELNPILGYLRPGGNPTVVISGKSGFLTAIHEQAHFDDLNNTIFGMVVRCEHDITKSHGPGFFARLSAKSTLNNLLNKSWKILEGSAVSAEFIHLLHLGRTSELDIFRDSLPRSYRKAASPFFWMLLESPVSITKLDLRQRDSAIFAGVNRAAIAELALDLDFLRYEASQLDYEKCRMIAKRSRPTKNLEQILSALIAVDFSSCGDQFAAALADRASLVADGPLETQELRLSICIFKKMIAEFILCKPDLHVSDKVKLSTAKRIREELQERYSDIPKLTYFSDRPVVRVTDVTGGKKLDLKWEEQELTDVDFLHLLESDDAILQLIPPEQRHQFMCRMIWIWPIKRDEAMSYFSAELSFSEPLRDDVVARILLFIRYSFVQRQDLLEALHKHPNENTLGVLGLADFSMKGELEHFDTWSQIERKVVLWSPVFASHTLDALSARFGDAARFCISKVPGPLQLIMIRCEIGSLTVFWIDTGPIPIETIKENGGLAISKNLFVPFGVSPDDPQFLAAYVAALHVMPGVLKAMGPDSIPK